MLSSMVLKGLMKRVIHFGHGGFWHRASLPESHTIVYNRAYVHICPTQRNECMGRAILQTW